MAPPKRELLIGHEYSFFLMKDVTQVKLPGVWTVVVILFGEPWNDTSLVDLKGHFMTAHVQVGVGGFFPLARARIQALACSPPSTKGLALTHWSVRELTRVVLSEGIIETIHYSTVCLILQASELQPHRYHYWKTQIAEDFIPKAATVLWYYEQAPRLAREGILVMCLDEKPTIQALERRFPSLPMKPGQIERREYEYIRHGTLNWLVGLRVHDGRAWGRTFAHKSQEIFAESLDRVAYQHKQAKKIHFIIDNDPTHKGQPIDDVVNASKGRIAIHYTPVHASWLNQADILLSNLSRKYLHRGSWNSKRELSIHLRRAIDEYNSFHAAPLNWSFTRNAMRNWYEKYCSRN
jgi:hypothetical protein